MFEIEKEDKELNEMFHGEEKPLHPETVHITLGGAGKPVEKQTAARNAAPVQNAPEKEKPMDASWKPVKPDPNFMDKLKATAKEVGIYGVLSLILFWWQQTGRLEETTAWYSLLVCVGMVFFSIGKNCRGGVK